MCQLVSLALGLYEKILHICSSKLRLIILGQGDPKNSYHYYQLTSTKHHRLNIL